VGLPAAIERWSMGGISDLKRTLDRFDPDRVECWGQRSICQAAVLKSWTQGMNRLKRLSYEAAKVDWTAVHTSSDHLLRSHLPGHQSLAFRLFDRHLIRNELAIDQVQARFPAWRLSVLPWMRPATNISTTTQARQQIRQRLGIPVSAKLVGTCARLIPPSRIKDFIWAADLMACIRDDVYWVVLGQGAQKKPLQRYAGHLEVWQIL